MLITLAEQYELAATESEMEWFKDAKFGIFVHWGPALSVTSVLSWGRDGERPAANKPANGGVPAEIYDRQYLKFNPVDFDADKWMRQVRAFGASYLVFTAKHHDGFCLFDAPNTDYDVMSTPYGRDIAAEIAEAAHRHGIKLFWYYSQPDWTHPDCLREDHYASYLPYMKEQVEHLYTNYGRIDGVFWDGLASKYWQWDAYRLMRSMKEWQPGIISNPRGGFSWPDNSRRGDYDTPEQSLGPVNHGRYWEACLTMTDKWLYSPGGTVKPAETILGMLSQVVGNGGNLLLNFGPDGRGNFVEAEATQGARVGEWLDQYGHTLYGTRRGIYIGGDWGASTQRNDTLFLHVLQQFGDGVDPVISLPELPVDIREITGVTSGLMAYETANGQLRLTFDSEDFASHLDNIVMVVLEESPEKHDRIPTWSAEPLTNADLEVSASSVRAPNRRPEQLYQTSAEVFSEGIRLKNWWQPSPDDPDPSLTLTFPQPEPIVTLLLSENMRAHNVRQFVIEGRVSGQDWQSVYEGRTIGEGLRVGLSGQPLEAIRLRVTAGEGTPQITAFNVYAAGSK